MRKIIFLLTLILASSAGAQMVPKNLQVEYQEAPLVVDTPAPRFSWEVSCPERGCGQAAYEIWVAESEKALSSPRDGLILWDSGKVKSAENVAISYAGLPLQSMHRYFWAVQIWDENDQGRASKPAFFHTGLLNEADLKGEWIWEGQELKVNDFSYFRRSFDLGAEVSEAYALVSAHHHYVLFVNGERISGYMSPGPSDPYKHKTYLVYDIGKYLHPGKNVFAAMALYKGADGQNYIKATPGFLLEARIRCKDGKEITIGTGPEWRVLKDTAYDESAPFLSKRKHTTAEYFDAGKEPAGWTGPEFDDGKWAAAVVVNPGFKLSAQYTPEGRMEKLVTPEKIRSPWPGVYVADLGMEISGGARVTVAEARARPIQMRYSDRLIFGRASWGLAEELSATQFDRFTPAGKARETWEPLFGYRGFRYIEVTGFPGRPGPENIQGVFAHSDLKQTGEFVSSNELLNRIYEISIQTQKMGMLGQLVDCAHREQSQWHADADMQSGTIFYNFYDPQIVRKTLIDLGDGQFEDGRLHDFYPASENEFGYIPEWDMHYLPMLWRTYYFYNDRRIFEDCWPVVKKMIDFYETWRDETGLLMKSDAWHISDWTEEFARMDQKGKYLLVENCLYYEDLKLAAQMGEILGDKEAADKYRQAAGQVKEGINKYLYNKDAHAYYDSYQSKKMHQAASVLPLLFGIVPEGEEAAVLSYVKSKGFGVSVCMMYFLMDLLYEKDEGGMAYQLTNKETWPGWGFMIKMGDNTTWESWFNLASRSHPFNAYMARYFISGIVGLKPAAEGWKRITVRPHVDGDLQWASAGIETVRGKVSASWEKKGPGLSLSVSIPGNTEALVCVPAGSGKAVEIYEGRELIYKSGSTDMNEQVAPALQLLDKEEKYVDFIAGAGQWEFKVSEY